MDDEVIRGSIVLHKGKLMWPPPAPPAAAPVPTPPKVAEEKKEALPVPNYFFNTLKEASFLTGGKQAKF